MTDVAVVGGRIAAVGELGAVEAAEVVEGAGAWLCPGFIDLHAHSALAAWDDPLLTPKLLQGFTTEVICPDGLAPAPVAPDRRDARRAYLRALEGEGPAEWTWTTFAEYLDALDATRPALSLVPSIGHGSARDFVLGDGDVQPSAEQLRAMRREIRLGLEAGARMLSFGLVYIPGAYARTDELAAVAEEAAAFGAPLVPHVRNEGAGVLEAVGELIDVARRAGAPLHLSHLKSMAPRSGRAAARADRRGERRPRRDLRPVPVRRRRDPAREPAAGLGAGGRRRGDPRACRRPRQRGRGSRATSPRACPAGRTCSAPSARSGSRSAAAAHRARRAAAPRSTRSATCSSSRSSRCRWCSTTRTEEAVRQIARHRLQLVGSDGIFGDHPHPRLYGTAPRFLGRFAIREGLLPAEEAVARLTARAADRLGLTDRGRIEPGKRADLVLLDPERYVDTATYEDPKRQPRRRARRVGRRRAVVRDGQPTGARPGGVVR